MILLTDTVALVWHLRRHRKLGQRARQLLEGADAAQHKLKMRMDDVIERIITSPGYVILPLNEENVRIAGGIGDVPELHDRMLVATARLFEVPILTNDPVIAASRHVTVIW
jgi:PIN domain nuclease of toxin-antitoxin system